MQDRHRSRASWTAGSARPPEQSPGAGVQCLLEHPGASAGAVLLLARGLVARAHDTRRRRGHALADAGAAVRGGSEVAVVVQQPQTGVDPASRSRRAQVGLGRSRVDQDTAVEQAVGVAGVLDGTEQVDGVGVVHQRQQRRAGPAVAVLAGEGSAVARERGRAGGEEVAEGPPAVVEGEVDAHVHAAVAEVAVGHAVEPVLDQQRVEVPQPGAEVLGRHGGVLPPRVRRAGQAAGGQPGPVLADPPQRGGLAGIGDQAVADRSGRVAQTRDQVGGALAGDLREEPAGAGRQVGDPAGPGADQVDDAGVEALAGDHPGGVAGGDARAALGPGGQQRRHGVGGLGHGGIAEHQQQPLGVVDDQGDRGLADQGERPLRAGDQPVQPAPVLGQQLLERVAADLAGEPSEGASEVGQLGVGDRGEVALDPRAAGGAAADPDPLAGAGQQVETDDVVGGPAVAEGARAAGVVADHAADGAAGVRGRVGPEAQSVVVGPGLEPGVDDPGLHRRGARLGVQGEDPRQVPCGVQDDPRTDGVAGDRGAGAAHGQRHAQLARDVQGGVDLVRVPRARHDLGDDAVQRGVGGVERAGQRRVVDVGHAPAPQGADQVVDDLRCLDRCAHQCSIDPRRMPARSSGVASRGAVASSRCWARVPSTSGSTSASP